MYNIHVLYCYTPMLSRNCLISRSLPNILSETSLAFSNSDFSAQSIISIPSSRKSVTPNCAALPFNVCPSLLKSDLFRSLSNWGKTVRISINHESINSGKSSRSISSLGNSINKNRVKRIISRILSSLLLHNGGDNVSGNNVAIIFKRRTRIICPIFQSNGRTSSSALIPKYIIPISPCSVRGLPCHNSRLLRGKLLPHRFTLTLCLMAGGGLFSVALSVGYCL